MAARTRNDETYDPTSRRAAVTAGVLFLTATVTFLIGDTLIMDSFSPADGATTWPLPVGVALQALCALAGAGIGVALFGVLSRSSRRLATGYLAFRCLEGLAILAIGAYVLATTSLVPSYEILIYGFTGVAGLLLSSILLRTRLVPGWLSWLGIIGYVAILLAIPATLLDIATLDSGAGMLLYVPGGLFELLLPVLLISRGFRRLHTPVAAVARRGDPWEPGPGGRRYLLAQR